MTFWAFAGVFWTVLAALGLLTIAVSEVSYSIGKRRWKRDLRRAVREDIASLDRESQA